MGYNEGYRTGYETAPNPFSAIMKRVDEARARKMADDKDLKDLNNLFLQLGKKHEYEKSLEGEKVKQKALYEDYEIARPEEEAINFQGTPFESIAGKGRFKKKSNVEELYKQENLKYMQNVNKQMSGASGGEPDLIYRRADTGEEVSKNIAEKAIASGDRNYIINQRNVSKAGVKETPLIKSPDLTQEEKQYVIASKRIQGTIKNLTTQFPELYKKKGSADWKSFQAQSVPFFAIGNKDIEDIKSSINNLKADIPFLRGGKQLTPTEAKRIDILLNPFGKDEKTYKRDIEKFKTEFMEGTDIMIGGVSAISRENEKSTNKIGRFTIEAE